MKTEEAANIIETIIRSINNNPNQFQFTVNVNMTGFSAASLWWRNRRSWDLARRRFWHPRFRFNG